MYFTNMFDSKFTNSEWKLLKSLSLKILWKIFYSGPKFMNFELKLKLFKISFPNLITFIKMFLLWYSSFVFFSYKSQYSLSFDFYTHYINSWVLTFLIFFIMSLFFSVVLFIWYSSFIFLRYTAQHSLSSAFYTHYTIS